MIFLYMDPFYENDNNELDEIEGPENNNNILV